MVNTKIRLIIFFAAKDIYRLYRAKLYTVSKTDQELTVAQNMKSLLSDLN